MTRPRPLREQLAAIDADARAAGYTERTVIAGIDRLTGMPSYNFTYGPPSTVTLPLTATGAVDHAAVAELTANLLALELGAEEEAE